MTGNVRQTPPEPTCGTLWVTSDNSPTGDGTGPQNGPEGTEDMESLKAMRLYVSGHKRMDEFTRSTLLVYANEIEREVEEARDREYRNGREDAAGAAEFADRLCRASERREDVTLWGVDYMPLPLDADGVPIHVGDVMETDNGIREVDVLQKSSRKWSVGLVPVGGGAFSWHDAETLHHRHAPTVEDVLDEFVARWMETHHDDIPALKAEYAAKLRLAGDE